MAGAKKTLKEATAGRDKEIRVRYLKPETLKALAEVGGMLKTRTIPDTVVKLIHSYKNDQDLIRQLRARNSQLNANLLKLVTERKKVARILNDFMKYTVQFNNMTTVKIKALAKQITLKGGASKRR